MSEAYLAVLRSVDEVRRGSDRGARWLKVTSGVLFVIGAILLFGGGLSGSPVSAASGAAGLLAASWSIRQLYHVWKDGRFLEMIGKLVELAEKLPEPQRTELLKRIAELMLEWAKAEVSLPEAKS